MIIPVDSLFYKRIKTKKKTMNLVVLLCFVLVTFTDEAPINPLGGIAEIIQISSLIIKDVKSKIVKDVKRMPLLPELQHITSSALPYLLSVPLNNKPANGFPLICFLHGYDEAEPHNIFEALTKHGPLNPNNPDRVKQEFIIVAPQMPRAGDLWRQFSNQVYEIVQNVQKENNANLNQTYLTGFSYGGNGVFDVADANPNFWAALWSVDPTRVPKNDPNRPIWISIGSAARFNKNDFIKKLNLKSPSDDLLEDRIYLDENADHVGCARLAYKDEKIYNWLLSKNKKCSCSLGK